MATGGSVPPSFCSVRKRTDAATAPAQTGRNVPALAHLHCARLIRLRYRVCFTAEQPNSMLGAVVTGALNADELAGHGHDVDVLDQRDIFWSLRDDVPCTL